MKKEQVLHLVYDLDWSLPEHIQKNAITQLTNVDPDLCDLLVQPRLKSTWLNATKVIKCIGYPKNIKAIPSLIWLLQDLSWPGVPNAIDIMKEIDTYILVPLLEQSIKKAYHDNDSLWLAGIKEFISSTSIIANDFSEKGVLELLSFADW
ncbi:MAG: hypothetical protein FWH49_07030 [Clostridiales bacterium]|nr:hypothetical protein [Clostridiales bacterium]